MHAQEDVGLERVGVLVLVDQDVVEHARDCVAGVGVVGQRLPVQQQVVVVEHVLLALAVGVGLEHLPDAVGLVEAPREVALQDVAELRRRR